MKISATKLPRAVLIALATGTVLAAPACSQAQSEAPATPQAVVKAGNAIAPWTLSHVDAAGASALLTTRPEVVVLDIRSPRETQSGHIKGAVFANYYDKDFAQQLAKLDKQTPYLLHCRSGGRSTKALATLKQLGFRNIIHLDGGISAWQRAGLPLTTP